jgi:hypothetical protein
MEKQTKQGADFQASGWLRTAFWASLAIALAAALRRLVVLARPPQIGPPSMLDLDAFFASRAALTLVHIVPAMIFVLVAPFVILRRDGRPWAERVLVLCGVIVGLTAYALSAHPVGGWVERSAVVVFNGLFLYALLKFNRARNRGDWALKQRWVIRSVAILLGIATTRPVMGVFFATSSLTHLRPDQFFGIAFWIGFSINTAAVEIWLRSSGVSRAAKLNPYFRLGLVNRRNPAGS